MPLAFYHYITEIAVVCQSKRHCLPGIGKKRFLYQIYCLLVEIPAKNCTVYDKNRTEKDKNMEVF